MELFIEGDKVCGVVKNLEGKPKKTELTSLIRLKEIYAQHGSVHRHDLIEVVNLHKAQEQGALTPHEALALYFLLGLGEPQQFLDQTTE